MQSTFTAPIEVQSRNRHLGYLDSLRGIAILLVLWVHAGELGGMPARPGWPLFFIGQRGVELFYEVSAFTLFLSLAQGRREHAPLRNFYLRRFFRIAPAFYVALLAEFIWVGRHVADRWRYVLAAGFLNGWSPKAINLSVIGSWSIAVEAMFYLLVPMLFRKVRDVRSALLFFLGSWVCSRLVDSLLAHTLRHLRQGEYFTLLWPVAQIPVFAMGILAFRIYQVLSRWSQTQPEVWTKGVRKQASALLLLVSAILFFSNVGRANGYVVAGSFCFVTLLLAGELYAWPLLFNRALAWTGKISFSLYLLHFFLLPVTREIVDRLLQHRGPLADAVRSVCAFGLLSCLAMPLSWLTWRAIEVPGIGLGRALIRRLEGRVRTPAPLPTDVETSTPGFQF